MSEPLSLAELDRMRAEHVVQESARGFLRCATCLLIDDAGLDWFSPWPCDAAKLLAELDRVQEPNYAMCDCGHHGNLDLNRPIRCRECGSEHLRLLRVVSKPNGIAYGLLGPATSEELAR